MADPPPPLLPTRFVSQAEIESTNAKKEQAWKAAYARIGQEPPVREVDEKYDGRSLAEKLASNRAAKQEEFENSHKLSAQFRSLDPDEINFLDEVAVKRMEEERRVKEGDEEMLRGFRAAVQARDTAPPIPGPSTSPTLTKSHSDTLPATGLTGSAEKLGSTSATNSAANKPSSPTSSKLSSSKPAPSAPTKTRSIKAGLKGVVVSRKRSKAGAGVVGTEGGKPTVVTVEEPGIVGDGGEEDGEGGDKKRRRVE